KKDPGRKSARRDQNKIDERDEGKRSPPGRKRGSGPDGHEATSRSSQERTRSSLASRSIRSKLSGSRLRMVRKNSSPAATVTLAANARPVAERTIQRRIGLALSIAGRASSSTYTVGVSRVSWILYCSYCCTKSS